MAGSVIISTIFSSSLVFRSFPNPNCSCALVSNAVLFRPGDGAEGHQGHMHWFSGGPLGAGHQTQGFIHARYVSSPMEMFFFFCLPFDQGSHIHLTSVCWRSSLCCGTRKPLGACTEHKGTGIEHKPSPLRGR